MCHSISLETSGDSIVVGTWNVAGKTPPPKLDLEGWLHMEDPADIYVLGYDMKLLFIEDESWFFMDNLIHKNAS